MTNARPVVDWQIDRQGDSALLGISTGCAVLDVEMDSRAISECITFLKSGPKGPYSIAMGRFGPFEVTLVRGEADEVSIFVDGPREKFGRRSQSAAIWVKSESLLDVLSEASRHG